MEFLKRTWAEINIPALLHNYNLIKKQTKSTLMPVIKANAYGHSDKAVALALYKAGSECFAVSNLIEALRLREYGIDKPILILGYTPEDCAEILADNNITQAVFSYEYAKKLSENAGKKTIDVHIKLDTGMGRIGFDARNSKLCGLNEIINVYSLENLSVKGVFTHFCVADSTEENDISYTKNQYQLFSDVIASLKAKGFCTGITHCSNSAGIIMPENFMSDVCRPGIILYGLNPSNNVGFKDIKPVMTLKSVVSMVKTLQKGDCVSYGRTFKAENEIKVATVSAGYADGYPRLLSNTGEVIIKGKRAQIIGNICMDQFMIDVTDIEGVCEGDEVILFGERLTADDIAKKCGTIGYEITCGISPRVPRVIISNEKEEKI